MPRSTKPLPPVSKRRRALKARTDAKRAAYVEEMVYCAVFPHLIASECHEMAGGSDREKALSEPACWLAVSHIGHGVAQYESKARQLARKLVADPTRFSLEKFAAVYTGKEKPVTLADVAAHLQVTTD